MFALRRVTAAVLALTGCSDPSNDGGESGVAVESSGGTPSTTGGTAPADSTGAASSGDASSATSSSGSDASSGDSDGGTLVCDPGREPSETSPVDGCPAVVGAPRCSEGATHVPQDSAIAWMSDPPASGNHYPTWAAWGEHTEVVPRGNWVHNLEHGGIVLAHRCPDGCPELDTLREVIAMRPDLRILMTLDPFLPGEERFAAISWTWVLRFDAPDLAELLCFADQHENHAPEDVP